MRTALVAAAISLGLLTAAPAWALPSLPKGTRACAAGKYVVNVRVKGMKCASGRRVANYWETTGRGNCRPGWTFRNYALPAGSSGSGASYLSCKHAGLQVFWVEGEGGE